MVLYRPFLHYVSPRFCAGKDVTERAYACGAAYITVARNIIHIGTEMRKQVSLVGPYWFTLFSEFFAIISLVFYVLENRDKSGSKEILADAIAGKTMIGKLAARSMVADRISSALEVSHITPIVPAKKPQIIDRSRISSINYRSNSKGLKRKPYYRRSDRARARKPIPRRHLKVLLAPLAYPKPFQQRSKSDLHSSYRTVARSVTSMYLVPILTHPLVHFIIPLQI